jgi:hypothetical protein
MHTILFETILLLATLLIDILKALIISSTVISGDPFHRVFMISHENTQQAP